MLKVIWTMRHTIFAKGHRIKRCWTVSFWSQKQHFSVPCHFLLIKLSFVNRTLLFKNHIKTLIFSGTFIFQRYLWRYFVWSSILSRYMDLTVYYPDFVNPHLKTSLIVVNWTSINREQRWIHLFTRFPDNACRKPMFRGVWDKTEATEHGMVHDWGGRRRKMNMLHDCGGRRRKMKRKVHAWDMHTMWMQL
jgi:hypothetical protein